MWKKAMLYLGLGPDEEYDDASASAGDERVASPARAPQRETASPPQQRRPTAQPTSGASVRQLPSQGVPASTPPRPAARAATVRPMRTSSAVKPVVVAPSSFNEAQIVADHFRANEPVIMNLQGVPRDLSRRLIDFASGVCYGIGGQMERVASDVFLLTPSKMEVSKEERRRLHERGLHDS
jgi:cell division inhibitor SepF